MKNFISLSLLWIGLISIAKAQDISYRNIVNWNFDNNKVDQSPNSYNGSTLGNVGFGLGRNGSSNGSLAIIDNNDAMSFPDITLDDMTVSFWMKPSELPDVSQSNTNNLNIFAWSNGGGTRSRIYINGANRICVETNTDGNGANFTNHSISINTWYHVVITRSGDDLSLYLNGNFIQTTTLSQTASLTLDRISWDYIYRSFKGLIDDVHIYDRPSSNEEVRLLYGEPIGMVAHWTFDNTLHDESENDNHGNLLYGAALDSDRNDEANNALHLSSVRDAFEFDPIELYDLSLSFWMRIDELPDSDVPSQNARNILGLEGSGGTRSRIFINGVNKMAIENDDDSDYGFNIEFEARKWYHVVLTRSGNNLTLFVNGESSDAIVQSSMSPITLDRIGWDFNYRNFLGYVDDMKIYNRALSTAEALFAYYSYEFKEGFGLWKGNENTTHFSGKVSIGQSDPGDADLAVNGLIGSQEIILSDFPGEVPDYVFDQSYDLRSLEEVKGYIDDYQHLPEVPSAQEMTKNGMHIAEMNLILLKKIEELTLYQIQLLERLEEVESKLDKQ